KDQILDYLKDIARKAILSAFGIDINVIDFILHANTSDLLGVQSITIFGVTSSLFRPTDHDRLDRILGFTGTDFTEPLDMEDLQAELDEANEASHDDDPDAQPISL